MNAVAAVLGRAILFIASLVYVVIYATIRTVVEIVNWPFEKIEDKAEALVISILDGRGR